MSTQQSPTPSQHSLDIQQTDQEDNPMRISFNGADNDCGQEENESGVKHRCDDPPENVGRSRNIFQRLRRLELSSSSATVSTGQSNSSNTPFDPSAPSRAVWRIRIVFVLSLVIVALALGISSYIMVCQSERKLGESQFRGLAGRALHFAEELAVRRRVVVKSVAQVAASAFPDASAWPNVVIPAFEVIAEDATRTTDNLEMAFYPMVQPEAVLPGQQAAFEEFAYDYFYNVREPPYPPTTAVKSFGRGIWTRNAAHDTTGFTEGWDNMDWESPYQILFPELQNNRKGIPEVLTLMMNVHGERSRGRPIDETIACSETRYQQQQREIDCGVITDIQYWDRASYLVQPIYPARDMFNLTGVIISKFSWDGIISKMFQDSPSDVRGLTVVLTAEGKSYSYNVETPTDIEYIGEGDLHEPSMSAHAVSSILSGDLLTGVSNKTYTLTVYPSKPYFDIYTTNNPLSVAVGAICIVVFMTLVFFLYDTVVQREFKAKEELFKAKRQFMRFVSHEVRTPLNAVCMGLTLLTEDVTRGLATYKSHLDKIHAQKDDRSSQGSDGNDSNAENTPLFSLPSFGQDNGGKGSHSTAAPLFSLSTQEKTNTESTPPLFSLAIPAQMKSESNAKASPPFSLPKTSASNSPKPICKCQCSAILDRNIPTESCIEEWQQQLEDIYNSAQGSVDVLNDLLNYDKIESNTISLELTAFSIWNLIQEVSGEFQLSAKQKGINLCVEFTEAIQENMAQIDPESPRGFIEDQKHRKLIVIGDRLRISQILRNLVSNAIKFTPERGDIFIRTDWIQSRGSSKKQRRRDKHKLQLNQLKSGGKVAFERSGSVEISVTDTGAGLSPDQVSRMFQEGVQFNVNELQAGRGSGLGLYISKGLARQHKGDLAVSSKGLGAGTTFTLNLPLYRDPPSESTAQTFSNSQEILMPMGDSFLAPEALAGLPDNDHDEELNASLKILVVDDIMTNRKLLARLLRNHGHTTVEAADGREAVEKVAESLNNCDGTSSSQRYDTILMDYEMPVLKGPEAAKEIRALGCDCFLVGITGNVLADDVNYFRACGANAVMPKPVDIKKLEELWIENGIWGASK